MDSIGHEITVFAREKEITCYLLEKCNIPYYKIAVHQKTILRKIFDYFIRWDRTYHQCKRIQPDVALGVGDFYLPQIGSVLGFTTLLITDTESVPHDRFLSYPFASAILTPSCFRKTVPKQIRFSSYKELAYLSPRHFTPDPAIYHILGLERDQRYVILRFTEKTAAHDIGCRELTPEIKHLAVREFSRYAKVFISSEQELSDGLEMHRLPCPPEWIHHALHYADLLYGDSATMASEAACLGTPAIYVDDHGRGYTDELENRYGLVFNFKSTLEDQIRSIRKGVALFSDDSGNWRHKRDRMLGEKVEMTDFLIRMVLARPDRAKI